MAGFGRGILRLGLQPAGSNTTWGEEAAAPVSPPPAREPFRRKSNPTTPPFANVRSPSPPMYHPKNRNSVSNNNNTLRQAPEEDEGDCKFCQRPTGNVICRGCGYTFEGRVSMNCPDHPGVKFLLDQTVCPKCLANQIREISTPKRAEKLKPRSEAAENLPPPDVDMSEVWE